VVAIPLLLAWAIDPIRGWLEANGHVSERSVTAISALTVISAIIGLRALARMLVGLTQRVESLQEKLSALQPSSGRIGPTNQAQQFVMERVIATRDPARKEALLLAQNLMGSIPLVFPILKDSTFEDWKLHIFCVDPDVDIQGLSPAWRALVRNMSDVFVKNLLELSNELTTRRVLVSLTYYRHLPVVHGLLLADGSFVVTVSHWDKDTILADADIYDFIDANDLSPRAQARRQLLRNWIDAAGKNGRPAILDNKVVPAPPATNTVAPAEGA
jgi:hypothetical protein